MALSSKISSPYVRELTLNETMDGIGGGPRFVVETMLPDIVKHSPYQSQTLAIADTREEAEAFIEALDPYNLLIRYAAVRKRSM